MTDPFNQPASASGIQWADFSGRLLLFSVHALETGIKTSFGDSDAVRATVVVLDGPQAGEDHVDVLVFPKVLQSQLRPSIGAKVLGRLGQGQAKPGQSPPWMLSEATEADKQVGLAYLSRQPVFAAPAGASASDGPRPPWA